VLDVRDRSAVERLVTSLPPAFIEPFRVKLVSADAEELHAEFGDLLSDVDRR
jgi:hypothetical protein